MSAARKARLKDGALTLLGPLVSWSATYRIWKQARAEHRRLVARLAAWRAETGTEGGPRYRELSALPRPERLLARAVAFYLPQFHPVPENDLWWGKGFTEWTNVRRARPLFEGHRQPRRPGELGYYDLVADPAIRRRQAALASQYGLAGFCFYYYWFGGRRILDQPVEAYARDQSIDFPFCLCWANESWSRRWDGREDEILIAQTHSPDDDIAFIGSIASYLACKTYLRVDGRPLVLVYRPDKLPDPRASAARWRDWCRRNGIGEIFLAYTLSFTSQTPEELGFDAAIEFPPNNMGLAPKDGLVAPASDGFAARIYDLTELSEGPGKNTGAAFRLFRGVTPQWDNTARRQGEAAVFLDAGPEGYEAWLRGAALDMARREASQDARLVFINAWNEWAEGAYLEPDLERGYAWLEATRRALTAPGEAAIEPSDLVPADPEYLPAPRAKVLLVIHDLERFGAQLHALNLARIWSQRFGCEVTTIACADGPLRQRFEAHGRLLVLQQRFAGTEDFRDAFRSLREEGYERAIINSSAAGWTAPHLDAAGISLIGLVHELPGIIRAMQLEAGIKAFETHARHVVFASDLIRLRTEEDCLARPWSRPVILPQGLYLQESVTCLSEKEDAAREVRRRLGLTQEATFVIGAGYGDHRKAPDIFCRWAIEAARRDSNLHFLWIGGLSQDMQDACEAILSPSGELARRVHLLGFSHEIALFLKAATALALSAREDPYPSTALEALACGTPVLAVAGCTGLAGLAGNPAFAELADEDAGRFASALLSLTGAPSRRQEAGRAGIDLIRSSYGFQSYAGDLLRLAGHVQPRISVIVPNYNYARYLPQRLASLLNQQLPVWEILFLDDASADGSVAVAEQLLRDCGVNYRIIVNRENSGSVFSQWLKGVSEARGELVWIAEADDWAASGFTRVAAEALCDESVVMSYTQSSQVSAEGEILCPHYLDYVADIDRERWRKPFLQDGLQELAEGFSVKNTVPNVSGAMFRREALAAVLAENIDELRSFRVAGDWCTYAHLARLGKIAFDPRPLNYHRRHAASVTLSRFTHEEWEEIRRMQARIRSMTQVSDRMQQIADDYIAALRQHF